MFWIASYVVKCLICSILFIISHGSLGIDILNGLEAR